MENENKKTLNSFRKIAVAEGWSFIVLLFIAMPLKHLAGFPMAVKVVGWLHGVLFVAYIFILIQAAIACSWKFTKMLWAFAASLIPFGTFVLDKQLKQELKNG